MSFGLVRPAAPLPVTILGRWRPITKPFSNPARVVFVEPAPGLFMTQVDAQKFLEQAKSRRRQMIALELQTVRDVKRPVTLGLDPPEGFAPLCHACPSTDKMSPTANGWRCDNCGAQVDKNCAAL